MNKVILIGRMCKKPEMFTTNNNVPFCKFSLAVRGKQKDENGEFKTEFLNCTAWKETAKNINAFCNKGDLVGVVGGLISRTYEKDDTKRMFWEINVEEIEFMPKYIDKKGETPKETTEFEDIDDDDIPF